MTKAKASHWYAVEYPRGLQLTRAFVAGDRVWRTDTQTYNLLLEASESKNESLFKLVFIGGQGFGCVVEDTEATARYLAKKTEGK